MLENFLKYHQEMISREFVDAILKRVEQAYQTRLLVLGVMSIIGAGLAVIAISSLMDNSWLLSIKSYLFESKNLIYLALIVLTTFLLSLFLSDDSWQVN